MNRIPPSVVLERLERLFVGLGFAPGRASLAARLFAEASIDGVASHGLNRVPRFVRQVRAGLVDPAAEPTLVEACGAWERWHGGHGAGSLNAWASAARAIELARRHGIGCVGLAHTNHWMRGGAYGWQAADAGCALLAWTNTMPNMAPWGAADPAVGNNPLVVAVPRDGGHVVVDMAMSQFSYGRLDTFARSQTPTPVPGGWDAEGRLTTDPAAVTASGRVVPTGYWKGSALAVVLDLLAVACSGGRATRDIPRDPELEGGMSQVFIAIDVARAASAGDTASRIAAVIEELASVPSLDSSAPVRYPGERALQARRENLERGVPVDDDVWREICRLN
jgi:3-dehydro-L-gulonate 2-dehydrogenase